MNSSPLSRTYRSHPVAAAPLPGVIGKCRLCTSKLSGDATPTSLAQGICGTCEATRPEQFKLGEPVASAGGASAPARNFTAADKALIRRIGASLPSSQLLAVLNDRLAADLGPDASPYTLEQLQQEFQDLPSSQGDDWASLRHTLTRARRAGTLDLINAQAIGDFAVVFALSPAQVLRLKDALLSTAR